MVAKIKRAIKRNVEYFFEEFMPLRRTVPEKLYAQAIDDSAAFAAKNMRQALMFLKTSQLWDWIINKIKENNNEGLCLEFGVFKGWSINYFSKRLPAEKFFGFDSFIGLQEDWTGWSHGKGSFDVGGNLPKVPQNVRLIKGFFDTTLTAFTKEYPNQKIKFLHLDSDTYESTYFVLDELANRIDKNTFILFDEYFGYRGWELGEHKAWEEITKKYNWEFEYTAFSVTQVLVRIK